MKMALAGRLAAMLAVVLGILCTHAQAADVKVLSTIAFQRVFEQELPAFNRASGHAASAEFGGTTAMAGRLQNGEVADVYFGTRPAVDALLAAGKLQPDSVVDLARSPVGMAVRKGAPRPDISTAAALRRALLAAKGITYPDPASGSVSAIHITKVAEQLGIAEALKAKTRRPPGGAAAGPTMLITGEADLAVQQNCELLLAPGVELLGPLPPEFQLVTVMSAAVPVTAREPAAARALIRYLQTPAAAEVMQRWGLEPLARTGSARSTGERRPKAAL
jgi:molybdate transport system substrate-binding protein